jgi:protein TonB
MKHILILSLILLSCNIGLAQETNKTKTNEPVLDYAEVEPEFPGGESAMIAFIQKNIVYPEYSREMGEQGVVYVQFVVNADGSISEVNTIKGVSDSLDAEAERVIRLMPNWKPGMQGGKYIRVRYTIPISFTIDNGRTKKKRKK